MIYMLFLIYVLMDFVDFLLYFDKLSYNLLFYDNKRHNLKRPYYFYLQG